jgi:hypothetical protein
MLKNGVLICTPLVTPSGLPSAILFALALLKADHSAFAECDFFFCPRLRASSRATK